jgi:hypothetical protein
MRVYEYTYDDVTKRPGWVRRTLIARLSTTDPRTAA